MFVFMCGRMRNALSTFVEECVRNATVECVSCSWHWTLNFVRIFVPTRLSCRVHTIQFAITCSFSLALPTFSRCHFLRFRFVLSYASNFFCVVVTKFSSYVVYHMFSSLLILIRMSHVSEPTHQISKLIRSKRENGKYMSKHVIEFYYFYSVGP